MARGTSTLKRTPFASTSALRASSMTLAELREARGAKPLVRHSTLKTNPEKARAWRDRSRKEIKPNRRRQARRAQHYRQVLTSDFHKKLRYDAFMRSGGLCECAECAKIRKEPYPRLLEETARIRHAWTPIPVWFTKRGGEPWRRFRSTDGETHHDSYKFFGDENPAELELVRWVWKVCHQRIEAEFGTRRLFLTGKAAA